MGRTAKTHRSCSSVADIRATGPLINAQLNIALDDADSIQIRFFDNNQATEFWQPKKSAKRLWQRRPREMNVPAYGIPLGAGAIAHTPFLLLGSPRLYCLFHACYMLFILWVIGVFLIKEARYRRWKKDYLRAVARLAR